MRKTNNEKQNQKDINWPHEKVDFLFMGKQSIHFNDNNKFQDKENIRQYKKFAKIQ